MQLWLASDSKDPNMTIKTTEMVVFLRFSMNRWSNSQNFIEVLVELNLT